EYIVKHRIRYIYACGSNAIAELHCGVNLIDQQAALRIFQYVDGENTSTDCPCSTYAQVIKLRGNLTIAGHRSPSSICDPVLAGTVDGTDGAISYDKGANIALGLIDIILYVVDMMLIGAKRLL